MSEILNSEDCPLGCVDGKIFDNTLRSLVPCPHCSKKLSNIAKGKDKAEDGRSIKEILCIPKSYVGVAYDFDKTIPDTALITTESVDKIKELLTGLLNAVTLMEKPKCSCFINLGRNADILNFIFTYLITGFKNGLTVAPLTSSTDIIALRNLAEGVESFEYRKLRDYLGTSYFELEHVDLCVVTLDASITTNGVYAIKGLLEGRSRRGLATLVFTNAMLSQQQRSLVITEYDKCLHLLKPFEVQYTKKALQNEQEVVNDSNTDTTSIPKSASLTQEDLQKLYSDGNSNFS